MEDYTTTKSYTRYMELLNKICGSVLFLVLTVLTTGYCFLAVVEMFTDSDGDTFIGFLHFLPAFFSVFTVIGLWLMFFDVKRNRGAAKRIGLVKCLPKYKQVIRILMVIAVILATIILAVVMFSIQVTITSTADTAAQVLTEIEEMLAEFGVRSDDLVFVTDLLESVSFIFSAGMVLVLLIGAVLATVIIFTIIRYSKLCKLLSGTKKMYKSGKMRAPSTGFYVISSYIFAALLFIWNLGFLPLSSFSLSGFIYPAMMVISAIIVKQNSRELNDIYRNWQDEHTANK